MFLRQTRTGQQHVAGRWWVGGRLPRSCGCAAVGAATGPAEVMAIRNANVSRASVPTGTSATGGGAVVSTAPSPAAESRNWLRKTVVTDGIETLVREQHRPPYPARQWRIRFL
jgi:hypothetical protein